MGKSILLKIIKNLRWQDILLVGFLVMLDIAVHPLSPGPDRLVHDPAVYRLLNPNYMPGDWYTAMAVKSGVYIFYAKLIGFGRFFHLPEEFWRQALYLTSLIILYYSLIKIARLFLKSPIIVPIVALLHMMISTGLNQPIWLYGPFIQIDGGLAPRSIGVALSFLALYFLLEDSIIISSVLLGLATLVHVSNSFIVFTLFLLIWFCVNLLNLKPLNKQKSLELGKKTGVAIIIYLITGGWFAFYVASRGGAVAPDFATEKFIWAWIYFRAPYMALPLAGKYWWVRLFAHIVAIVGGSLILRKKISNSAIKMLNILTLVGLSSVVYFFIFYFFAFTKPWLPGFQFYSIRVIYLAYFVAYLFMSLSLVTIGRDLVIKLFSKIGINAKRYTFPTVFIVIAVFLGLFYLRLGSSFSKPYSHNIQVSWWHLTDSIESRSKPLQNATFQYLFKNPQPFLAPPDIKTSIYYLPNIASFKSFGFTTQALPEWLERLNDVSSGEIEKIYDNQTQTGKFSRVYVDWIKAYSKLTPEQVLSLAKKYNFKLFLTYRDMTYPFDSVAEDSDYRIYRMP